MCVCVLEIPECRKWSSPRCVLCAIKIIISAYLPEIEYLHLNLKLLISSFYMVNSNKKFNNLE